MTSAAGAGSRHGFPMQALLPYSPWIAKSGSSSHFGRDGQVGLWTSTSMTGIIALARACSTPPFKSH